MKRIRWFTLGVLWSSMFSAIGWGWLIGKGIITIETDPVKIAANRKNADRVSKEFDLTHS